MAVTKNARSLTHRDGLGSAVHAIGEGRRGADPGPACGSGRRKTTPRVPLQARSLAEKVGRSTRRANKA